VVYYCFYLSGFVVEYVFIYLVQVCFYFCGSQCFWLSERGNSGSQCFWLTERGNSSAFDQVKETVEV